MILDEFLNEMADALLSGTSRIPAALAYSTDGTAVLASSTSLDGELGDRTVADNEASGISNTAQWSSIRSSTSVLGSTGDALNKLAVTAELESTDVDDLLFAEFVIPATAHTTSFDIETTFTFTFDRQ